MYDREHTVKRDGERETENSLFDGFIGVLSAHSIRYTNKSRFIKELVQSSSVKFKLIIGDVVAMINLLSMSRDQVSISPLCHEMNPVISWACERKYELMILTGQVDEIE